MSELKFLRGGGEMGVRIRAFDWSATSLGAPSTWPLALKTLLGVLLTAKQPMYLAWGPELLMLYNDSYTALLGPKHPSALAAPFQAVWSEVWSEIAQLVDQVLAGEPVHMDDITLFVNRNSMAEEAHFAFSFTPVYGENDVVAGFFCPCSETTQQIKAERHLAAAKLAAEDANLAKSTFIANMSHELRTPLSAIIGYSEMLIEDLADGADPVSLGEDMRKIEGNARHLLGLINDVLDLSKIESGKMEVYTETFDVEAMIRDVASTVTGLLEKKGNRIEVELAPDLDAMTSDVTKIRQMLLNLLSNSAKFTEGGTVTLSVERVIDPDGDRMVFRVRDTGIGMTVEQLDALFQRFQQADASTTRKFGGTGLGLSITKAFCVMLGGQINVESQLGVGSTFTIRLPTELPDPSSGEADVTAGQSSAVFGDPAELQTHKSTVLVIDDDPAQRDLMARFLEREGFSARTASDGPSGLELARWLLPRAILLDVMMPGMDGWSVLTALKADAELAKIPVVMVTFVSERGLATALGAADYVAKPVKWERFRQVMDRFRESAGDVLIVDGDADTRQRVRKALERDSWTVAEASNGQEALVAVANAMPRVILLDLTMPVMDGFAFLHELRSRPGCSDIPVIVLSARDLTRDDRHRLREASQVLNKGETSLRDLTQGLRALAEQR